ncbi:MAG: 3-phosphoshikimate 1-carboxyvinyltransferase [Candidatus Eremiobacteraeota bacterium]|nr:3-phosphoshikimate 1-carboxyvinyltransferase [Candidatus Eremiobacteraeota bacterium]MBC5826685.1 3-phosphoshikimate 1-carboxyvinyltransferase [Candidatus Eremiobacteraeota bacterium]
MTSLRLGAPVPRHAVARMPGDKSISHRAVLLAALAHGTTIVCNLNAGDDVARSLRAARSLGAGVETADDDMRIVGIRGDPRIAGTIDCGNSGTTMRMLMGLLAGRGAAVLDGDAALRRRPMERVAEPLRRMGADVRATPGGTAPVRVRLAPRPLRGIDYEMPVPSAQLQSALLLAGLDADGMTRVRSPLPCRDHTARLLQAMGARIQSSALSVAVERSRLQAIERLEVPGDVSAAAFFLCAAAAMPQSCLRIDDVGFNPTRSAALKAMQAMGAALSIGNERCAGFEPRADVTIAGGSELHNFSLDPQDVPNLIDDIPALCALAAVAQGRFQVRGADELRTKESDRIATIVDLLARFGVGVTATRDGLVVSGGAALRAPAAVSTHGDHRIGMMAAVLAVAARAPIRIDDAECIGTSFPGFKDAWAHAFLAGEHPA